MQLRTLDNEKGHVVALRDVSGMMLHSTDDVVEQVSRRSLTVRVEDLG